MAEILSRYLWATMDGDPPLKFQWVGEEEVQSGWRWRREKFTEGEWVSDFLSAWSDMGLAMMGCMRDFETYQTAHLDTPNEIVLQGTPLV